nr:hypothetical protein BaRGS_023896 [Batillaria attramentaria]
MFSLVIAASYSSTLTAFLSVTKDAHLFSDIDDLVTKTHEYTWGVFGNSSLALTFQVWNGIQRFSATDKDVLSQNITRLADKVRTENFVWLITAIDATQILGKDCDIEVVAAGVKQITYSLVLPKGSALTKPLSDVIRGVHSAGIMSQWTSKWVQRAACPTPPAPKVITLLQVQGVLLVLPVGVGLALVTLAAEIIYTRQKRPQYKTGPASKSRG